MSSKYRSNEDLVESLRLMQNVDERVRAALRSVDRKLFVKEKDVDFAYTDCPLSIGFEATISAPHMHATALSLLSEQLKPGKRVLDVGSGSGILLAYMAVMTNFVEAPATLLMGIDIIPELVSLGRKNLARWRPDLVRDGRITIKHGDGWEGDPSNAPFDAINVGAAAKGLPTRLLAQLNPNGGQLMLPYEVEHYEQYLLVIERAGTLSPEKPLHRPFEDSEIRRFVKCASLRNGHVVHFVDKQLGLWKVRVITQVAFVPLIHKDQARWRSTESTIR